MPSRIDAHQRAQVAIALADGVGSDHQALAQRRALQRPPAVQEPGPVHHRPRGGQPAVDLQDGRVEHVVVVQAQRIGDEPPLVLHGQADAGHAVDLGHGHGDERVGGVGQQRGERNRRLALARVHAQIDGRGRPRGSRPPRPAAGPSPVCRGPPAPAGRSRRHTRRRTPPPSRGSRCRAAAAGRAPAPRASWSRPAGAGWR